MSDPFAEACVLTGMGVWTAAGHGVEPLMDLLLRREDAFRASPPHTVDGLTRTRCAVVAGALTPRPGLPSEAALSREMWLRPAETLLHVVVADALEAAFPGPPPPGTGLVVGTTSGNISGPWERWHRAVLAGGPVDEPEDATPRRTPAQQVARSLGLNGPVATVSLACASGIAALAVALAWLADERAPAVVVAGVDALSTYIHAGFHGLGALSATRARPLHPNRDGLTLGEGAAALVLEPGPRARARGARILAEVGGVGLSGDAIHASAPDREGAGASRAFEAALSDAGIRPSAVDLLSVHGTGTLYNDAMEARAILRVFGPHPPPIHGVKGAIGHTLGAAGAVEMAVAVEAFQRGIHLPPFREVDPALGLPDDETPATAPTVALLTNSAFGGANACAVLAQPGRLGNRARSPRPVQVVATDEGVLSPAPEWSLLWPDAPARFIRANRYIRVGLYAAHRILGLACGEQPPEPHVGIVLSSASNCLLTDLRYHARLVALGPALASRADFVATVPGAPAGEASVLWGLKGPFLVLAEPMDAALDEAKRLIRWGRARELVVLGLEVPTEDAPARFHTWYVRDAGTVDSPERER